MPEVQFAQQPGPSDPAACGTCPRRRIAVVHTKGFSGVNGRLIQALTAQQDVVLQVDSYDVLRPRALSITALANLCATFTTYGIRGCVQSRMLKTPWAFRVMTQYAEKILSANEGRFDLVLQTQALCGVGRAGRLTPHVVITDCTYPLGGRIYAGWRVPQQLERLEAGALCRAALVVFHNAAAQQSAIEDYGVPAERTCLIGCGVDAPMGSAASRSALRVACVTTDPQRQRVAVLRQAFAEHVRPSYPDAELTLAGPHVGQLAPARPGERLVGYLDRFALSRLLSGVSIYVMPAQAGGYSSVLDAMAHGCAVVVVAGNPFAGEETRHGHTAWIVPSAAPESIAEGILTLLKDPTAAQQIGARAADYVLRHRSWPVFVQQLVQAIDQRGI